MRRDKRLYPLSWGHHHGLAFAQRIQRALSDGRPSDVRPAADELRRFFHDELQGHFAAEDEVLFPAVRAWSDTCEAEIETVLAQHAQFARLLEHLSQLNEINQIRDTLRRFGDLLVEHIRFEERVLFPKIEGCLSEVDLDRVGRDLAARLPGAACELGDRNPLDDL